MRNKNKNNIKQSRSEKMVEERKKKTEISLPFLYLSSCSRFSDQNINQNKGRSEKKKSIEQYTWKRKSESKETIQKRNKSERKSRRW